MGRLKPAGQAPNFRAQLDGLEENPSVSTTGHGRVEPADRRRERDDRVRIELRRPRRGRHEAVYHRWRRAVRPHHVSAPHVNGGVATFFCGGGGKPACPTPSGTVTGVMIASDIVGPGGRGSIPARRTALARSGQSNPRRVRLHQPAHDPLAGRRDSGPRSEPAKDRTAACSRR